MERAFKTGNQIIININMKTIKILLSALVIISAVQLSSCGHKNSDSPVDQYIQMLDEATEKTKQINSFEDLTNVQDIISPEKATEILRNNMDYVLTKGDKGKLKKSYDKLLKVAYEKTTKFGGFPEEVKKATMDQADLVIDAANKRIDEAETLGDLIGIR